MKYLKEKYIWTLLRFGMGWIFLWAFLDKVFGFGFATPSDKSWLSGISPTEGFLKFGTHGPLSSFFQNLAGSTIIDWLFMLSLLFIGIGLLFKIKIKFACYAGALLMLLIWLSIIPPEHNPIIDDHIIYMLVFLGISIKESKHSFF